MQQATLHQQPAPPSTAATAPRTQVLPAVAQRPVLPSPAGPAPLAPARDASRSQRTLQLLGLGALVTAMVAYAPYAGGALVALVVLLLRTASVTRQRHGRRRLVRGRARWYDVPTTTVATPAYAVIALLGTVMVVVCAGFAALAMFSLGYLLGQPTGACLVLAGLGFTPMLWWGPGSGRLREMTRGLTARTARSEFGGWLVIAMSLLGATVLLGLLSNTGANWAPALSAPWR